MEGNGLTPEPATATTTALPAGASGPARPPLPPLALLAPSTATENATWT
jgi:hypothetical protein